MTVTWVIMLRLLAMVLKMMMMMMIRIAVRRVGDYEYYDEDGGVLLQTVMMSMSGRELVRVRVKTMMMTAMKVVLW